MNHTTSLQVLCDSWTSPSIEKKHHIPNILVWVTHSLLSLPKAKNVLFLPVTLAKKSTCPLKGDHFKRKFHLPTINFQGISYFSHPHLLVTEGITHGHMQQRRILRIFGKFLHDFGGHVPLVGDGFHPEKHDGQRGTLPKTNSSALKMIVSNTNWKAFPYSCWLENVKLPQKTTSFMVRMGRTEHAARASSDG